MAMLCFGLWDIKEFERDAIYPPGRSRNGYQEFLHVHVGGIVDLVRRHFLLVTYKKQMIHIHFTFKPKTDALRSLDDSIQIIVWRQTLLLAHGTRAAEPKTNKFIYLLHHYCVIRE